MASRKAPEPSEVVKKRKDDALELALLIYDIFKEEDGSDKIENK